MKHKWHDEIIAWAGGSEIEVQCGDGRWITSSPSWSDTLKYRIKPQPKEKKFLYIYHRYGYPIELSPCKRLNSQGYEYLGKIEVQDD